jgi:uncharacterized membrane protein YfcA
MLEPLLIFELAALGLATGFLAGLLGIGGGMLIGPFMTIILSSVGVAADLAVKMAIATSMATIMFTSISSVRAHHKRGAVRWDIVKGLAPGILIGWCASPARGFSPCSKARRWPSSLRCLSGFQPRRCSWTRSPSPAAKCPAPQVRWRPAASLVFCRDLVGAGGGFVSVPFMVAHNVAIINAVATSAALGFPIALANTVGYVISGASLVNLPIALTGATSGCPHWA